MTAVRAMDVLSWAAPEAALLLLWVGLAGALAWALADPTRIDVLAHYERAINQQLERALKPRQGRTFVRIQVCLTALLAIVAAARPVLAPLLVLIWWLPRFKLARDQEARVRSIEEQLDGWLMGLASALRTAPALGDAIASTLALVRGPLRAELTLVLRQFRLGVPLDEALAACARRLGSPPLSAIVATLRVARRTGGNLGNTLERNANALREMARLEGVVRAKTASGRAQANAISVVPLGLLFGLHKLNPTFLEPVINTPKGHALAAVAGLMWLVAVVWARKIVEVEI